MDTQASQSGIWRLLDRTRGSRKPSGICSSSFFDWTAKEPALRSSDSLLALIRVYKP